MRNNFSAFVMAFALVILSGAFGTAWADLQGDGSQSKPYKIASLADWKIFVSMCNNDSTYGAGKYFELTSDITIEGEYTSTYDVSQRTAFNELIVGNFSGTFNGGDHTLTFNYTKIAGGDGIAPFDQIANATIRNLKVAGTISTNKNYAGGIAYLSDGSSTIENCTVSITINSSIKGAGWHGGFVGRNTGALTFKNCVFNGSLLGSKTYQCGGFVGYLNGSASVSFTDCFFAPAQVTVTTSATFSYSRNGGTSSFTRAYYTTPLSEGYYGVVDQGTRVYATAPNDRFTKKITALDNNQYWAEGSTNITGLLPAYVLSSANSLRYNVEFDGATLTSVTDYTASITKDGQTVTTITETGTYTLTITGKGDYAGSFSRNFEVYSAGSVPYISANGRLMSHEAEQWSATSTPSGDWWYVTGETTIGGRIDISGKKYLILCDGATLTLPKGIHLTKGNTLYIYGQSAGTGKLIINGVDDQQAGIGGNDGEQCGTLYVNGGEIEVKGGTYAAGIGGGKMGNSGTITISGGKVTAQGGSNGGAGIGGGNSGNVGTITISGGKVTAQGGSGGAGIGGYNKASGTVSLNWKNPTDRIYASSYKSNVEFFSGCEFILEGTDTLATTNNIGGKTIVPKLTATFNANGHGTAPASQSAGYGAKLTKPEALTADDYTFEGWYKESDCVNEWNFDSDTLTGNITLYGKWTATEYTITYNGVDGATFTEDNLATYTIETAEFTLTNPTKAGYTFTGWTGTGLNSATMTVTIPTGSKGDRTYTAGFEKNLSHWGKTDDYTPDGTSEKPYVISNADGWNLLVNELNIGNSYSGKVFRLDENLTVATMLGMNGTGFAGTFEGNSKTLTFNYEGADDYVAPFRNVNGGTIKDLTVKGTIKTSGEHVGGIVGQSSGETTIEACNFVGKLLTTNVGVTIGGGFVAENNGTLTISNSLYAPATLSDGETEPSADGSATFARNNGEGTSDITNSYYLRELGMAQGTKAYSVTASEGITVTLVEKSAKGFIHDERIYAGSGETVSLTISGGNTKDGYTFKGYAASAGTLTESEGKYSLTMPAENVTISAEFVENISYIDATGQSATTSNYTVMTSVMTNLTAGTYVVKESVTVSALTLVGDVELILCDGATLTVTGEVSGANSLVIYGQSSGTGTLIATTITLTDNKNLSVYGGTLTAGTISVAGTVTVKNATVNGEKYDGSGDSTTSYTVTFDSNGGSAVTSQTLKFKYGETVKATKPTDPTREGYTFRNWHLNGSEYDFSNAVSSDITLTAAWTFIKYTITYNLDGGTNDPDNPDSYDIELEVVLENPTKSGYTFMGWTGEGVTTPTIGLKIKFGSTGNRTYTANWEKNGSPSSDLNAPKFKYQSLLLDGKIAVSFAMDLSSLDETVRSKSYMTFDISGDKTSNNPQSCLERDSFTDDSGNKYYYFNCYIKSIEMANNIRAEFHYSDDKVVSKDYTARQYLNDMLADEEYAGDDDYSVAVRNLVKAIKDYGHYAQLMLSEYHDWSLGGDYAPIENENTYVGTDTVLVNEVKSATERYAFHKEIQGSEIQGVYFSLDLDSYTTINLLIEATSDVTASFKNGGGLLVEPQGNNQYLIEIEDIPAHELDKTYDVVINAGESSCEVNISALSYVYGVLTKETDHEYEPELAIALYKYYKANEAYRPLAGYTD